MLRLLISWGEGKGKREGEEGRGATPRDVPASAALIRDFP